MKTFQVAVFTVLVSSVLAYGSSKGVIVEPELPSLGGCGGSCGGQTSECWGDACGGGSSYVSGGGDSSGSEHSYGSSHHSSSTSVTKEWSQKELKINVGLPLIKKARYTVPATPVEPEVCYSCSTGHSYAQPEVITKVIHQPVIKRITRVYTPPITKVVKVVKPPIRVIKKVYVQEPSYQSSGGWGGSGLQSGGYGHSGGSSASGAFAYASAGAGSLSSGGYGGQGSGNLGSGCTYGCGEQWK